MKKFLTIFFITLGVIFFILIIFGTYLYIADPLNLKPLFTSGTTSETAARVDTVDAKASTSAEVVDKNPSLSPSQEAALEKLGIDPAAVPSTISPQQEACFVVALGEARVSEIKAGAAPTASDLFKARGCIQ